MVHSVRGEVHVGPREEGCGLHPDGWGPGNAWEGNQQGRWPDRAVIHGL